MKFPSLVSKSLTEEHLLLLTQRLLDSIAASDWETYQEIVHPEATCFEPEAGGSLIAGYPFHKFWFDAAAASQPPAALPAPACPSHQIEGQTNLTVSTSSPAVPAAAIKPVTSICSPHVRLLGENKDVAVLCYTRIVQKFSAGKPSATQSAETRVFEKQSGGKWRLMHLHRHGIQSAL